MGLSGEVVAEGGDVDGDEVAVEDFGDGNPVQDAFVRLMEVALGCCADVDVGLPELGSFVAQDEVAVIECCDVLGWDVGFFVDFAKAG